MSIKFQWALADENISAEKHSDEALDTWMNGAGLTGWVLLHNEVPLTFDEIVEKHGTTLSHEFRQKPEFAAEVLQNLSALVKYGFVKIVVDKA